MGKLNQYSSVEDRKNDFIEKLESAGRFVLIGKYVDWCTKTKFKCKLCDSEFECTPNQALVMKHCPTCRKVYFSRINGSLEDRKNKFLRKLDEKDKFVLIGRYTSSYDKTFFKCKKCGFVFESTPSNVLNRKCCTKCEGLALNTICKNRKTINDTHPHIVKFLKNREDAFKFSFNTGKKIWWICPDCGKELYKSPKNIINENFICEYCGDGFSIPSKFLLNLLKAANIKFDREVYFEWRSKKKYRYDFYISNYDMIIEVNGMQHYSENGFGGIKLRETQINDFNKKFCAVKNGITKYIELDFRYSDLNFMIQSVKDSEISSFFDFNVIDMEEVCKNTYKSILISVCEYYNNQAEVTPKQLEKYFKISYKTITSYLKIGTKLGICNYSIDKSNEIASKRRGINRRKAILQYSLDGKFIKEYSYVNEIVKTYNVTPQTIARAAQGKVRMSCGYIWKYKEGE